MLTAGERQRRPTRSLRAEYDEFIEQRIEEYKDGLPREDILGIGDEAVQELARTDQYALTEILLAEQVDSIIRRRLRLPSYRRWRERHLALRAAQTEPTHWGLAPHDPVVALADLLEDQDWCAVVGAADGACALFLAARGANVLVGDPDLAAVEGLENRAIAEQLGSRVQCVVVPLESWDVGRRLDACVIETAAIAPLAAGQRADLVARLRDATEPGGHHAIMPVVQGARPRSSSVSTDILRALYADCTLAPASLSGTTARRSRHAGFLATLPDTRQTDTAQSVSN